MGNHADGCQIMPVRQVSGHLAQAVAAAVEHHGLGARM